MAEAVLPSAGWCGACVSSCVSVFHSIASFSVLVQLLITAYGLSFRMWQYRTRYGLLINIFLT